MMDKRVLIGVVLLIGLLLVAANEFSGEVQIGGGYGSTGVTLEDDGDLSMDGNLVVDGTVSFSTGAFTTLDVGGGYGDTGASISADGTILSDGTLSATGKISANGGLSLGDNDVLEIGSDDDWQIYSAGTELNFDDGSDNSKFVFNNGSATTANITMAGVSGITASYSESTDNYLGIYCAGDTSQSAQIRLSPISTSGQQKIYLFNQSTAGQDGIFKIHEPGTSTTAVEVHANAGTLWVQNNCSADSFTDRSPVYTGDALLLLSKIKAEPGTEDEYGTDFAAVDHDSLSGLKVKYTRDVEQEDGTTKQVQEEGRNLGKTITVNSKAILELLDRIETLETRVTLLEAAGESRTP